MTANYSMQLSTEIKDMMRSDISGLLKEYYPMNVLENSFNNPKKRNRVYNDETTLLTMIITSVQEDKSLQNSVNIYSEIHKDNIGKINTRLEELRKQEQTEDIKKPKKAGRPKEYKSKVAKSKLHEVSSNTSAYTQARQRLDMDWVKSVYEESSNFDSININNKWKGMEVYITDGTYIQMQDTRELKEIYEIKSNSKEYKPGYPQGLLQLLIEQGSGAIKHFELGNRHVSELELISKLLPKLKKGSLLLADDLYNSYAIFSLVQLYGLELIVPGKRIRNYKVIKEIAPGDEIVEVKMTKHPSWLPKGVKLPAKIVLRRLTYEDPLRPGEEYVLYTTITEESICKTDIVIKHHSRWDIEISIREIKTLMDINVVRSKSPKNVMKEILTTFIAYNLIRKILANTTENSGFSPKASIIQKCFEAGKTVLMDKKGRIYNRWSPGRYAGFAGKNFKA